MVENAVTLTIIQSIMIDSLNIMEDEQSLIRCSLYCRLFTRLLERKKIKAEELNMFVDQILSKEWISRAMVRYSTSCRAGNEFNMGDIQVFEFKQMTTQMYERIEMFKSLLQVNLIT
jgi:hypothetical protein